MGNPPVFWALGKKREQAHSFLCSAIFAPACASIFQRREVSLHVHGRFVHVHGDLAQMRGRIFHVISKIFQMILQIFHLIQELFHVISKLF
jgi:UDP-N-acetylmuramyl pentapeptide synthase